MRSSWPCILGFAAIVLFLSPAICSAQPPPPPPPPANVPEIDAGLLGQGLALLVGGLTVLGARLRRS